MENVDFNFNNTGGLEKNYLIHKSSDNDNDNFAEFSTRPILATRLSLFLLQKIKKKSPYLAQIFPVLLQNLLNL